MPLALVKTTLACVLAMLPIAPLMAETVEDRSETPSGDGPFSPAPTAAQSGDALGDQLARDALAASDQDDAWKAEIDRFLADYLPTIVVENPGNSGTEVEVELPILRVEAEVDDAREKKVLPDRWEILSEEAKKRALAYQHLTLLETKVLNRWILWWGIRPEDYVLMIEERERVQREMDNNRDLLKTLEKVRPGILTGTGDSGE